jgi:predicted O-methyltransferase YrrM
MAEISYVTDHVGSHIPVLDLIKRLSSVRKVLEFGSGIYSTNKLLELPCLESLISYEDSKPWFDKMARVKDDRFKLVFEVDLLSVARSIQLDEFDLIFIDCCDATCDSKPERASVIEAIARRKPQAVVIVHDFDDELEMFPWAIENFDNTLAYHKFWPTTGILWNQIEGSAKVQNVRFEGAQGIMDT